jgi:hypothetical protein
VSSMGVLQMLVTLVLLGGIALVVSFLFLGVALRWLWRFKRDGGDRLVFVLYLLFVILGAGFFTTAVVGVTISSVQGTHVPG